MKIIDDLDHPKVAYRQYTAQVGLALLELLVPETDTETFEKQLPTIKTRLELEHLVAKLNGKVEAR
jgi:hypothetical protein